MIETWAPCVKKEFHRRVVGWQKPLCFLFVRLMPRKSARVSTALGVVKNNSSVSVYSRSYAGCPADSQQGVVHAVVDEREYHSNKDTGEARILA